MKLKYSVQIFEKYSNIKLDEDPSIASQVFPWGSDGRTDGRADRPTDMRKLIVAFRNFSDAPKTGF